MNENDYRYTLILITIPRANKCNPILLEINHDKEKDVSIKPNEAKEIIEEIISIMQNRLICYFYNWQIEETISKLLREGDIKEGLEYWRNREKKETGLFLKYKMSSL